MGSIRKGTKQYIVVKNFSDKISRTEVLLSLLKVYLNKKRKQEEQIVNR